MSEKMYKANRTIPIPINESPKGKLVIPDNWRPIPKENEAVPMIPCHMNV